MKGLSSLTVDRGLCNTIAMKKTIIAGAALFTVSLLKADVGLLAALPWIGDGLPDRNGADWYEFKLELL